MDRFRTLQQDDEIDQSKRRRASHAGFEAPRFIDLRRRRQSLPAQLVKKEDTSRKLHNSAACVNIIEDLKSVKLIPKNKTTKKQHIQQHALDPFLQLQLRARRESSDSSVLNKPIAALYEAPSEPKKATSVESVNKVDRDGCKLRKSSSESLVEDLDFRDPEAIEVSDNED